MVKYQGWADWPFRREDENLSIIDVVNFRTIDYKLAGLLWLLMEQRASVIVAAAPIWAGKTTLLHAMLDFLPPEIEQVTLQGYYEDFKHLGKEKPENTYLVTEEISNHQYEYLWGYQVVKAFGLLPKGYAIGGTTHARSVKEVAYILNALGVPQEQIARLGAVVTMQVARGKYLDDEPIRYVDSVSMINLTDDGLVANMLAQRRLYDDELIYPPEKTLQGVLSGKFGAKYSSISAEIEARERILKELGEKKSTRDDVVKAVKEYYRAKRL